MSSMRNAVQRRNHKERAQPKQREKCGLLEKHKDYSLRAKDFNEKKKRLKILRQKAADRNPDEFHFAMMSSKTDSRGVKIADRGNAVLSPEAVLLLKTQDIGYVRTMAQKTRNAVERLDQTLTLNKTEDGNFAVRGAGEEDSDQDTNHVTFVGSVEEQQEWAEQKTARSTALADRLQDDPLGADLDEDSEDEAVHTPAPSRKSLMKTEQEERLAKYTRRRRKRYHELRETTLRILRKRENDLRAAETQLEIQRSQMSGGHGIGITKKGTTFKNKVRKR